MMSTIEISKLAQDRGCTLKVQQAEDAPTIYWVENQVFIGKPFSKLDELAKFINLLPVV